MALGLWGPMAVSPSRRRSPRWDTGERERQQERGEKATPRDGVREIAIYLLIQ